MLKLLQQLSKIDKAVSSEYITVEHTRVFFSLLVAVVVVVAAAATFISLYCPLPWLHCQTIFQLILAIVAALYVAAVVYVAAAVVVAVVAAACVAARICFCFSGIPAICLHFFSSKRIFFPIILWPLPARRLRQPRPIAEKFIR